MRTPKRRTPRAAAIGAPGVARPSQLRSFEIRPTRVVWTSARGVTNADALLEDRPAQAVLGHPYKECTLALKPGSTAGILLDFGTELQGYVELVTTQAAQSVPTPVRVRLGESVSEAMGELGRKGSGNDHAIRDESVLLPWLGKKTIGPSGFRFVRIDAIDPALPVTLAMVRAVLVWRDIPQPGSFRCSDRRLNRIWQTSVDTVHLCMQEYLWDGIKRDRLVWMGDMYPEVRVIEAAYGHDDVVPGSLDFLAATTPPGEWMDGISSYTMWWVLSQESWWMCRGDRRYLGGQLGNLRGILNRLMDSVGADGREKLGGTRFIDWSSLDPQSITAGLQALLVMSLEAGGRLMTVLDEPGLAKRCVAAARRARGVVPTVPVSKFATALLATAGMIDPGHGAVESLGIDKGSAMSPFGGYIVLEALAKGGKINAALDLISRYWGGMLDHGATTFWEAFDLRWIRNAGRIDELPKAGKDDVHGDFGDNCYPGFRKSLCHGWAGGPAPWLTEHVLGIEPVEPGCAAVRVAPQLGRLKWAEGVYPTPFGPVSVRHERRPDGSIDSRISAPPQVRIVR